VISTPTIAVTRIGALFHYAIPKAIHRLGWLDQFYTDLWTPTWMRGLKNVVPSQGRFKFAHKLLERYADELPSAKVTAFPSVGVGYQRALRRADSVAETIEAHINAGDRFCEKILRHGLGVANMVYTTNTQGVRLLTEARRCGLKTIMEQTIAPFACEREILGEERALFPQWEKPVEGANQAIRNYCELERLEWEMCDAVLCGSEFVKNGLIRCGVEAARCHVVPYGFDFNHRKSEIGDTPHPGPLPKAEGEKQRPLRVLTVGTVCLRKGAPWIAKVAEKLHGKVEFRMVGGSSLSEEGNRQLASVVQLTGTVPRSEVAAHYAWADVFLLPSLCEGSATVVYEAQSMGLPAIVTPNTGSQVQHGMDGFVVPIRDQEAMIACLLQLDSDRDLLAMMSRKAVSAAFENSLDAYAERLRCCIAGILSFTRS